MQESKFIHEPLPLEKTMTLHNDIILIMSVFNKKKNVHINHLKIMRINKFLYKL